MSHDLLDFLSIFNHLYKNYELFDFYFQRKDKKKNDSFVVLCNSKSCLENILIRNHIELLNVIII